jgi:hypothetical protein
VAGTSSALAIAADEPASGLFPAERRHRERRLGAERRRTFVSALLYGGIRPRRRGGRRASDHARALVDRQAPTRLMSATLILILCLLDAGLTLALMNYGAVEANPLMGPVVAGNVRVFALVKVAVTGLGLLCLLGIGRFRVFRVLEVGSLVHGVLAAYLGLVGYELWLYGHFH